MGLDEFQVFANSSLDEEKYPRARLSREKHDPCVVASLHRLGFGSNPERQLSGTQWDVVIADECHRLRMYGTGDGQTAQKWYRLFERIIGDHLADEGRVYFLSGTPHQGNREVFLNMISLMRRLGRGPLNRNSSKHWPGELSTESRRMYAIGTTVLFFHEGMYGDPVMQTILPSTTICCPILLRFSIGSRATPILPVTRDEHSDS